MLDIKKIVAEPEQIAAALKKRNVDLNPTELIELHQSSLSLRTQEDELRCKRNTLAKSQPTEDSVSVGRQINLQLQQISENRLSVEKELTGKLEVLPNLPADDLLEGGKENNVVLRQFNESNKVVKPALDHVEIEKQFGLVDFERGTKLSGSGFWIYTGLGARLEWALLNHFIETHIKNGYQFLMVPHILEEQSAYAAGQLPKFREELFWIEKQGENLSRFLLPTAETAILSFHREEILANANLPLKYFAYTPCFRREAGGHRHSERGTIRGHQFNKVEMFQFARPAESEGIFLEMVSQVESILSSLELHFQTSKLAAGDCGFSMAKTFDVEVWIPSIGEYKEVSSASNAGDFQARRANIRYRPDGSKKNELVHTLNASGLATSRLLPALLEQNLQPDGRIAIPEVLRKSFGQDFLEPIKA